MSEQDIVALCMGAAFLLAGILLTRSEKFARWGLNRRSSRIWIRLLGEDRALKVTRVFFGPLTALIGVVCLLMPFIVTQRI